MLFCQQLFTFKSWTFKHIALYTRHHSNPTELSTPHTPLPLFLKSATTIAFLHMDETKLCFHHKSTRTSQLQHQTFLFWLFSSIWSSMASFFLGWRLHDYHAYLLTDNVRGSLLRHSSWIGNSRANHVVENNNRENKTFQPQRPSAVRLVDLTAEEGLPGWTVLFSLLLFSITWFGLRDADSATDWSLLCLCPCLQLRFSQGCHLTFYFNAACQVCAKNCTHIIKKGQSCLAAPDVWWASFIFRI